MKSGRVPEVLYCPKCEDMYDQIEYRTRKDFWELYYLCPKCHTQLKFKGDKK